MKIICGIYKITSPSGKVYIGQSKNVYKRWTAYNSLNCKSQPYIYNSLRKYGVNNHKFEIIYECDEDYLLQYEEDYIYLYDSNNAEYGLNINCYSDLRIQELKEEKRLKEIKLNKKRKYNREYRKRINEEGRPKTDEDWNELLRGLPDPLDEIDDRDLTPLSEEDLKDIPF